MAAKNETSEYAVATRFGGRKKMRFDRKLARPANSVEVIAAVKECYAEQKWDDGEQQENHRLIGLGAKSLDDLTGGEIEIVRADCEKRRMILYEG